MSSSSSRKMNEDVPRWLQDFLEKKFFDPCPAHSGRRNELNLYCTNCKESACQHGVSSGFHQGHQILKLYKYMYKDVVRMTAMQACINCSQIQHFKCNNRLVLHRLPLCGSALDDTSACSFNSKRSNGANSYQYCSIACKVKALSRKAEYEDSFPPQESREEKSESSKRKRKRKGTPHRALFF